MTKFALLLTFLTINVYAQSAEETLDSIKVSGNKEGRTYAETPESVTILPPARLNRGDQANSLEVLNAQANVQVQQGRNEETFSIRGINSSGVTGFQKDNLASIYVDDVFQTDLALKAGSFEIWDIEKLEILRGPQSTSQGVNSLAGAILLNHTRAHEETEGAVKLGYGSFNRREVGAFANHSFLDQKLSARINFNYDANDGFIKNKTTDNDKFGKQEKGNVSLDFKYQFDNGSYLHFMNKFLMTDNGGNYTVGGSNPYKHEVFEDVDFSSEAQSHQHSLTYVKPINSKLENKTTLALSFSELDNSFDAGASPDTTLGTRKENADDQFISIENVLKYESGNLKNALGFHAHHFKSDYHYDFALSLSQVSSGPKANVIQDTGRERLTLAVFDSALYRIDKKNSLLMGLRYEFVKNDFETNYESPDTLPPQIANGLGFHEDSGSTHNVLPKIGWIHELNRHTFGFTYSQGYRIGGVDINRQNGKTIEYDPETTHNYELSWKWDQGQLKTQANIFYTYWKDQQVQVRKSSSFFDTQVENAANSELYGAELEANYAFKDGHSLRTGVGYTHTQFIGFKDHIGNQFPDAAPWSLQAAYRHLISDRISSNLTMRYLSESYNDAENEYGVSDQFYTDFNVQYTADSWVWELNAKNILDNQYVINKSPVYENYYKRVNRPRELGTRFTWFF